jgi:hypothetical protein
MSEYKQGGLRRTKSIRTCSAVSASSGSTKSGARTLPIYRWPRASFTLVVIMDWVSRAAGVASIEPAYCRVLCRGAGGSTGRPEIFNTD